MKGRHRVAGVIALKLGARQWGPYTFVSRVSNAAWEVSCTRYKSAMCLANDGDVVCPKRLGCILGDKRRHTTSSQQYGLMTFCSFTSLHPSPYTAGKVASEFEPEQTL